MTQSRKLVAVASMMVVLLVGAAAWLMAPRATHEIVLPPVGAKR